MTTIFPAICDCEDTDTGESLAPAFTLVDETHDIEVDVDNGEREIVGRSMWTTRRFECDGCGTGYEHVLPYGADE